MSDKLKQLNEPITYDVVDFNVPVKYKGQDYVLKMPSEGAILAYRNMQMRNARMVDGKLCADMDKSAESRPFLVSLCLHNGDGKLVPLQEVYKMDPPFVSMLHKRCDEMVGWAESVTTDQAKN